MQNNIRLFNGDSLVELKNLEDNSVDSVVTDPPYGISFMGKKWDYDVPSVELWGEVYRVLKPGGHLLSFTGSRTYHKIATNIEEAGFEIRDMINWIYGTGMTKSMNVGKKITGNSEWEGWGTQLKPSNEPIVMARKPLSEKTIIENVLKWGTGAINIDKSRVEFEKTENPATNPLYRHQGDYRKPGDNGKVTGEVIKFTNSLNPPNALGRFPANIIHDGSEEVTSLFPNSKGAGGSTPQVKVTGYGNIIGIGKNDYLGGERKPFDSGDGSASRFFYCAKPSRNERDLGLENFQKKINTHSTYGTHSDEGLIKNGRNPENRNREVANHHPTIKPIKLMEYLVNMVTPKNGIVLDPFMGSGTTGMAVVKNGFKFIGVEREKDYFEIAEARVNYFANNKVELDYSEDEEEQTQKSKPNKKITNSLF
jgi:site-specific DNA-methyltransferase (adenine-specific)